MKKPKILVVGSLVMDLIVTAERFPNAGETVRGIGFNTAPGGKGANQAVQAARLGADVTMFGKIGNDDFGKRLISSLNESGVNTSNIKVSDTAPTSVGNVQIQKNAKGTENRIIVVLGANMEITPKDVEILENTISDYDIVILQNEIPMSINTIVAKYAKAKGVPVMLNPAPTAEIPAELISCLTYFSPNEHEAADLVGFELTDEETRNKAINKLISMGVKNVLITLGENGCVYSDGKNTVYSKAFKCENVVDPTAAGDSFIGAFCTATASGFGIEKALQFANATACITVSKMGAQTSLPNYNEVSEFLKNKNI